MALIQVYHPIERKNIPVSKDNRAKCCVYGVIDLTGKGRDLVCGIPTKKFWDKDAECWDWKPILSKASGYGRGTRQKRTRGGKLIYEPRQFAIIH